MVITMELLIKHDGKHWVAHNEQCRFLGSTLEELDEKVRNFVKEKGMIEKGKRIRVYMFFENATIPQWMRQYAQHYFNRIIEVTA